MAQQIINLISTYIRSDYYIERQTVPVSWGLFTLAGLPLGIVILIPSVREKIKFLHSGRII